MLAPRDRTLLLESLRPPPGFRIDHAIGTSYSLDLVALLTAPLAFTFFHWEDEEGRPAADPLALLEAVRRHADCMHLFCQAGGLHAPADQNPLFAWLEGAVHEVTAPRGGVFHPKLWVLRYVGAEAEEQGAVRYRVLVLTRNLTFDRSWDTALVLDGELRERKRGLARMRPLGEMIAALPDMCLHPLTDATRDVVDRVADEIRRVELELPQGFQDLRFHPIGWTLEEPRWPFDFGSRGLVMSPFLSDGFLKRFAGDSDGNALISRAEALAETSEAARRGYGDVFVLSEDANPEEGEQEEEMAESHESADPLALPSGLHAKLILIEDARRAHVFTGSANATHAAWARNVEVLVELVGGRKKHGIAALLEPEREGLLGDLLEPWTPPEDSESDPERETAAELDAALDESRRALAESGLEWRAEVVDGETWHQGLHGRPPELPEVDSARVCPVSLQSRHAMEIGEAGNPGDSSSGRATTATALASFRVPADALSAFANWELVARRDGVERRQRFALCLPLLGAPEDRGHRVLRKLLRDRDTVLRLLYLLLAGEEISVQDVARAGGRSAGSEANASWSALPLFEAMVRTLDRDPAALEPVRRLVEELGQDEEGRRLLPEGFERVWGPIMEVARRRKS